MQFKLALTSLALAGLAAATQPASSCSTGPVQCCNSVQKASEPACATALAAAGVQVQDPNVLVGITCSPITVIGVGSGSCSSQAVCCEDNSHGGLVSVGCVPVDLAL